MAVCAIFAVLPAHAQTPLNPQQAEIPLLGMVLDRGAARLRPVYGVPGAATLGDPLDTGHDIQSAAVAASGAYALVLSGANSAAALLFANGPVEKALDGIPDGASQAILSPSGTAAAFYYSSDRDVKVIAGLPDNPGPVQSFDLSAFPSDSPLFAVSDDGASLLYSGGTFEVFVLGGRSGFRRLAMNGVPSALAFRAGSHDALVATPAGAEWITDTARSAAMRTVALAKNPVGALVCRYIGRWRSGCISRIGRPCLRGGPELRRDSGLVRLRLFGFCPAARARRQGLDSFRLQR